ncbi:MAG: acetylhydrolase [Pseudomonadota bacterium]
MARTLPTFIIAALLAIGACSPPADGQPSAMERPFADPGGFAVQITVDHWVDAARDRRLPVKIYSPDGEGVFPVVIFSHGLGGSREAAPYLGRHLASWGMIAVHIQHPGSDEAVWAGQRADGRSAIMRALRQATRNPATTINRFTDIPFVVDEIERRASSGRLAADAGRIGIAGHSFGAHTVIAAAGFQFNTPRGVRTFEEPRILAGAALSPPAPNARMQESDYPTLYGSIDIPILHLTGTDDGNPLNPDAPPSDRLIAFQQIAGAPQYLIVFDGGDHSVFSGRAMARRAAPDWYPAVQAATAEAVAAFFLATLTEDASAQAFIDGPGFVAAFDPLADVDRRRVPSAP